MKKHNFLAGVSGKYCECGYDEPHPVHNNPREWPVLIDDENKIWPRAASLHDVEGEHITVVESTAPRRHKQ